MQIANGNKCIIVAENLDLFEIFHKQFGAVFVVMDMVNLSAFDIIANIYGKLMIKLLGCFDFKLSCICYNKNKDLQVIEEVENTIVELFSRHYIFKQIQIFGNNNAFVSVCNLHKATAKQNNTFAVFQTQIYTKT